MGLDHVQQTLFFPLMGRAAATKRWPDLFSDPWAEHAVMIRTTENSTAEQLGDFSTAIYGARHVLNVVEVNRYLAEHPGAAVVNMGCGLDRLVDELDDAGSVVYNLDFPEVLEMRGRWIPPHPREVDLPFSITDHRWMDEVDATAGMIAVAAGVFHYLEVDSVRALVAALGRRFPGARLCYDAESPMATAGSERQIQRSGTPDAVMPFRVRNPREVESWSPHIADVRIQYDFSAYLGDRRGALPPVVRLKFTAARLARSMYEVVVTFRGPSS